MAKATGPKRKPDADLPFDEELLRDTEARYNEIKEASMGREDVADSFEALEETPRSPEAPSRGKVARELLRSNPPQAIAARLKRIGVANEAAERAAKLVVEESAPPAFEVMGAEAAEEGTEEPLGLERIIGRNELLGIQYLDGGQAASRTVARVVIRNAQGATLGYGTGSLISPRLLITNNHVLGDKATAADSIVEFNYQDDVRGNLIPKVRFRLQPDEFFGTSLSTKLDFTVVAVAETAEDGTSLSRFGFNPLGALEGEILAGESVTIIQHPNGEPKQIALRENLVLKFPEADEQFLHYQTDTTPGSSGSPVYNDQWELVALHHSGFPRRDAAGNILTSDGQIWKKSMGEHRIDWIANEGIRARAIVAYLHGLSDLSDAEKTLVQAVLRPTGDESSPVRPVVGSAQTPVSEFHADTPTVTDGQPTRPVHVLGPAAVSGAQAQWVIPLQVAISLGSPTIYAVTAAPVAPLTPSAAGPPAPRADRAGGLSRLDDETIREAKAELKRSATRTYLDEVAEAKAKTAYYRHVAPGEDPREFFKTLSLYLEKTHKERPKYAPARRLYPWVDLQPDKRIKSVYSGQAFDPLELIEMDAEVDRIRAERFEAFRALESVSEPGALEIQEAMMEATLPYNCEHVVPQSWFEKREPMRGDLHHLFACESGCNSFRGNTPYFDFRGAEEVVRTGCGRREANQFQPTAGLGAVARATLYFLLRYPRVLRRGPTTYTEDRLRMLLSWHRENPVGKYERHRNQAIYEVQGNRNPLIDHPEWADKIDFQSGLG